MKPMIKAAAACALVAAAPAMALPNAFWTFGWKFPAQDRPWTIGDAQDGAIEVAATPMAADVVVPLEPVAVSEPVRLAALPYETIGL